MARHKDRSPGYLHFFTNIISLSMLAVALSYLISSVWATDSGRFGTYDVRVPEHTGPDDQGSTENCIA